MFLIIVSNPLELWRKKRLQRIVTSTPLLDGYELHTLDLETMKTIHRQRTVCKFAGHLWEVDSISSDDDGTGLLLYDLVCWRCFPHIHSRRAVQSYNLFAITDKEQD